ncbi:MAG: 2-hydroxyacid dehydrogenase [Motiliproteus sp.]|nr:2-hydroxyacid dehydrogenase [Motiliproteus sp.]MCW9054170.1 2-hydroxyacid dehydrogenase [Motiliproteus sp.]
MKAVFLDRDTMNGEDLQFDGLETVAGDWCFYSATSPEQVVERIADADIVIVNKVQLNRKHLADAKTLKLVCLAATGTDNVDLKAAAELGITVSNCQGYGTGSVAQHVLTLMLALSTKLMQYHQAVQQGDWHKSSRFCLLDYPIAELEGKTLGLLGYGVLGQKVAELAKAFGMRVLISARPGSAVSEGRIALNELLSRVDYLSLHCPLTDNTRDLIGDAEFALMKSTAILINAARGGIVDEAALARALDNNLIAGAGVDVLSTEPPTAGNPLLACQHPNLIVTPHSAWGSREARQRIVDQLQENIESFVKGSPVRVVNG